jgi:hypothetical protein
MRPVSRPTACSLRSDTRNQPAIGPRQSSGPHCAVILAIVWRTHLRGWLLGSVGDEIAMNRSPKQRTGRRMHHQDLPGEGDRPRCAASSLRPRLTSFGPVSPSALPAGGRTRERPVSQPEIVSGRNAARIGAADFRWMQAENLVRISCPWQGGLTGGQIAATASVNRIIR